MKQSPNCEENFPIQAEEIKEKEQKAFFSLHENLFDIGKEIIENFYLQPLQGKKANLRDGYIERPVHGALHASRVFMTINLLHFKIKEMLPKTVSQALATLLSEFNLTEENALLVASLAGLMHDCARKGEGLDEWEKESGENLLLEVF